MTGDGIRGHPGSIWEWALSTFRSLLPGSSVSGLERGRVRGKDSDSYSSHLH